MFDLYKNKKLIAKFKYWEDAVDFIEELKRLNPNEIDRRDYKVKSNRDVIKEWHRK